MASATQLDPIKAWAEEFLDNDLFTTHVKGNEQHLKALQQTRYSPGFQRRHSLDGMMQLTSTEDGTTFLIYAAFARQTSTNINRQYPEHAQASSGRTVEFKLNISPYILSRIVDFWKTLSLTVRRKKMLEHHSCIVMNPDFSDKFSTIGALLAIYQASTLLMDRALATSAVAKIRHYLTKPYCTLTEITGGLKYCYGTGDKGPQELEVSLRKAFLTACLLMKEEGNFEGRFTSEENSALMQLCMDNVQFGQHLCLAREAYDLGYARNQEE